MRKWTLDIGQRTLGSRQRRVATLVAAVVVLSLADLALTLTHLRSIGMIEANPVAAWVIRATQSQGALVAFKLATVAVCAVVLLALRRRASAELASWVAVAVMVGMCLHWHAYSQQMPDVNELHLAQAGAFGEAWLMLD